LIFDSIDYFFEKFDYKIIIYIVLNIIIDFFVSDFSFLNNNFNISNSYYVEIRYQNQLLNERKNDFIDILNYIDRNCDGKISLSELKIAMGKVRTRLSNRTIDKLFDESGLDYDRLINLNKFIIVLDKNPKFSAFLLSAFSKIQNGR
jgi:hypothetical protein